MLKLLKNILFAHTSNSQIALKNSFWLFAGEFVLRIAKLGIFVYAARTLGVETWGLFSYTLALASIGIMLSDIGLNNILTREVAQHKESVRRYALTALVLKCCLLCLTLPAIAIIYMHSEGTAGALVLWSMIGLVFFDSIRDFYFAIARAVEKMEYEALIKAGLGIFVLAAGTSALLFSHSLGLFLLSYAVASFMTAIFGYVILRKYISFDRNNFAKELVRPILSGAWPLSIATVFSTLLINTDTLILKWLGGNTAVGYYAAAQKPVQLLFIIPNLIAAALFPILARLHRESGERFASVASKSIGAMLLVGLPIFSIGIAIAPWVIHVLFGDQYASAVIPLMILLGLVFAIFPGSIITNAVLAIGEQRRTVTAIIAGSVLNIGLSLFLIPRYGASGAAVATVISQMLIYFIMYVKLKRSVALAFGKTPLQALLASLAVFILSLVLVRLHVHALLVMSISVLVYGALLFVLRNEIIADAALGLRNIFGKSAALPTSTEARE